MFGFIAVKNSTSDEILDVIADYYKNHSLTLIEERIGNKTSNYAHSKKWYRNLQEYEEDAYPPSRPNFTTNFDLLENLEYASHEWKVLYFYPDYPIRSAAVTLAINVNCELSQLLSERLQTQVLQFSDVDTVDYYRIRLYNTGELIDDLDTSEGKIYSAKGQFENINTGDSMYSQTEKYLREIVGIEDILYLDEFSHITNEEQRRPLYLKGSPENVLRFFQHQGKFE